MKITRWIFKTSILKIINIKSVTFGLIMLVLGWSHALPMKELSQSLNYPVSWCLMPFIMTSVMYLVMFWIGIVYIHSDIPFMQHINMYQLIRTGRIRWGIGQVCGIFFRSLAAVIFCLITTIIPLFPNIEWTNEWGRLLRTAAMTGVLRNFEYRYNIYYEIFNEFTPAEFILIFVLICSLTATLIGEMMFLISLYLNRVFAVAAAMIMSTLLFVVLNIHPKLSMYLAFFVPTVWAEAVRIATPRLGYYWLPSISYMFVFLITGILGISIWILYRLKHIEFNWENDDI